MHIQVVTYRMAEITEAAFIEANREFAEVMAAVPGLMAKVWLRDPDQNRFGGLYLWQDRGAFERFVAGDLWAEVLADESLLEVSSQDFAVMESLTAATQPGLRVV